MMKLTSTKKCKISCTAVDLFVDSVDFVHCTESGRYLLKDLLSSGRSVEVISIEFTNSGQLYNVQVLDSKTRTSAIYYGSDVKLEVTIDG